MRHQISIVLAAAAFAACTRTPANTNPKPMAAIGQTAPAPVLRPPGDSSAGKSAPQPAVPGGAQTAADASAAPSPAPSRAPVTESDVTRRAMEVFGDSAVLTAPRDSAAADSDDDAPSWDIDVHSYESTDRVEHYLQLFSGPARERISERLDAGTRYEPMIRAKMRAGGLPEDMYYLALIESGFDPNAYSRAAAVGMWQFMASTARGMGMRVDWWVDERRDPVRSTTAAVRFIKGLKEQFGSLYLAAAAYNGGPGRIARGLSRYADDLEGTSGDDLFFALAQKDYLRNETKEYVPQLIAAALIAKEPEKYGMELHPQPPFVYDSVRVPGATPLAAVARASGATVQQIRELNPQILRGMTPPRSTYTVRIPEGTGQRFQSVFDGLPKSQLSAYKRVNTRKGDRLETLANRYGTSVHGIQALNPHIDRSRKTGRLATGQVMLIPSAAVAAAASNAPDPRIERYSRSTGTRFHVVRHGETLGGIAKRYHTTVKSLMRMNGLRREMIFPGQELLVSGRSSRRGSSSASTSKRRSSSPTASRKKGSTTKSIGAAGTKKHSPVSAR